MHLSSRQGLRWLQASILLALGLAPVAGCKGTITLDCTGAKPGDDGLVDCGLVQMRPDTAHCGPIGSGTAAGCDSAGECTSDTDCTAGPHDRCDIDPNYAGQCSCSHRCDTDADCGDHQACLCGKDGGRCVAAACRTAADCAEGQSCILYTQWTDCGEATFPAFACTTDHDECLDDSHCDQGQVCMYLGNHFGCGTSFCGGGRPFYVEGELTTAPLVPSRDWASSPRPAASGLSPAEREALARRWSQIGQLEHASVASFARFTLQLLSLGAPPELVEQATSAMADETLHARLAFGLASAYVGAPVGPGPLPLDGALRANDEASILQTLFREGCIGETLAAALAREERSRTSDPAVQSVLDRIARDEERHALLAWRALAWMVEGRGQSEEALAALADEIRAVEAEIAVYRPLARSEDAAAPAGTLDEAEMASLRVAVLKTVVLPAAGALFRRTAPARWTAPLPAAAEV